MEEIWKDIKEYEGMYEISNMGRVKSLKCGKEMIMKKTLDKGYELVGLYKDGVPKLHRVHRLVAIQFISNPNNYPIINHIDEFPNNNHVDNLEWCTHLHNNTHGTRLERMTNTVSKPIIQLTLDGEYVREFKNTTDVKNNGYIRANVTACCKGRRFTHRNYKWIYKEDYYVK